MAILGVCVCFPNTGKQSIWRQCPPSARKQSLDKIAKLSRFYPCTGHPFPEITRGFWGFGIFWWISSWIFLGHFPWEKLAGKNPPKKVQDLEGNFPVLSKQCPADGVWRIGRGGSPDRVLKTRSTPSKSSAGHGLPLREHLNSAQRMVPGGCCEGLFPDTVCWTRLKNPNPNF